VQARIRGVNTVRKRLADGSRATYYYHRATGKRLAGEPNSPEFLVSFAQAERAYTQPNQGTLAGLIREFDGSAEFARKAESTQREYRRMFRAIEDELGGCRWPSSTIRVSPASSWPGMINWPLVPP